MEKAARYRIGVTLGDPNGIGPEVTLKALKNNALRTQASYVLYGSEQTLTFYQAHTPELKVEYRLLMRPQDVSRDIIGLLDCLGDTPLETTPGQPSEAAAHVARQSLLRAVEDLREGYIHALVTGPVDKRTLHSPSFPYRGHTEYLSSQFDAAGALMMMVAPSLRLGLATGHIPLGEAPHAITARLLSDRLATFEQALQNDFKVKNPKIATLGLNPHAGDKGLIGLEEKEIIEPVLLALRRQGKQIEGPFSADGFFAVSQYQNYDGTLAMYHDQGLIPFKLLNFEKGVNYTAGLPVVRTSPDHGVAYAIAGKNLANASSMRHAIALAIAVVENRESIG